MEKQQLTSNPYKCTQMYTCTHTHTHTHVYLTINVTSSHCVGPPLIKQFKHGQSNPTYYIEYGGAKLVLRKKPVSFE